MGRPKQLSVLILASLVTAVVGTSVSADDGLLNELRKRHDAPGLVAVAAGPHGIVFAGATGRVTSGGAGLTIHSRFHIGSVSKPISATVAALAVAQGRLDWDEPLANAAPEIFADADAGFRSVTLRQLLSHTGGVAPFEEDAEFEAFETEALGAVARRLAFSKWLLAQTPNYEPGSKHQYSNAGYTIVASVMENIFSADFGDLVAQFLFEPLDMTSAGAGPPSLRYAHESPGHHIDDASGTYVTAKESRQGPFIRDLILPAGDFHMNMLDLARFGIEHLRAVDDDGQLLRRGDYEQLHAPVLEDYALGWNVRATSDSHVGGLEGWHTAALVVMKNEKKVYAVAVNAELDDMALVSEVIAAIRKAGY